MSMSDSGEELCTGTLLLCRTILSHHWDNPEARSRTLDEIDKALDILDDNRADTSFTPQSEDQEVARRVLELAVRMNVACGRTPIMWEVRDILHESEPNNIEVAGQCRQQILRVLGVDPSLD